MGNPHKGEVSFEANGKTWVFKLGNYARTILERKSETTFPKFFQRNADAWGDKDLNIILYAGLFERYQLTEAEIGAIIDDVGAEKVGAIVAEAINLAFGIKGNAPSTENPTQNVTKLPGIGIG